MNRSKTKVAGILNIVAYSLYTLTTIVMAYLSFVLIVGLGGALSEATGSGNSVVTTAIVSIIIPYLIRLALNIVCLVLSIRSLKLVKMSPADYEANKKRANALFVLNIIVVAFALLSIIISGFNAYVIIDVILWALLITAAVLYKVDMKKNAQALAQEQVQATTVAPASAVEPTVKPADDNSIEKLEKLNKLRTEGLITEEEYAKMKADLLK